MPGPLLGRGPLWFDSCKRPPPVGDHSVFAFWVVAYSLAYAYHSQTTMLKQQLYISKEHNDVVISKKFPEPDEGNCLREI